MWRIREQEVFPALFGPVARGAFAPTPKLFAEHFRITNPDPRWLHHSVFEFAPTPTRMSWAYVTSGFSNPWLQKPTDYDPAGYSGAGTEFVMQTPGRADWAVDVLLRMTAFDLLLADGRFPGFKRLAVGMRLPLNTPIDGKAGCRIRNLVATVPEGVPDGFALPSGKALFLAFTGATDAEIAFAQANTSAILIDRMRAAGAHPVTDPERGSTV